MLAVQTLRESLTYEPASGKLFWKQGCRHAGKEAGCITRTMQGNSYRLVRVNGKLVHAHRVAWAIVNGEWPPAMIDHKNGDGLDNRWSNLRPATREQNAQNRKLDQRSKTGATGVHFNRRRNLYSVNIKANGQRTHVGYFDTKDAAVVAANQARARLHGGFARQTHEVK